MSGFTDFFEDLQLTADPAIPVKGLLVSADPDTQGCYIYMDSPEGISRILSEYREDAPAPAQGSFPASPFQEVIAEAFSKDQADMYSLDQKLSSIPGMKQFKCGMVVRSLTDDGKPFSGLGHAPEDIVESIRAFFPKDFVAVLGDCVYVMKTSGEMIPKFYIEDTEGFEKLLEKHSAYAMKGNSSQWLKGLKVLFNQCRQTLPIAVAVRYGSEAGKRILNYNRFTFYYSIYLAERSAKRSMGSGDALYLCDAAVLTLTRYDRQFNSDLRDTLFIYLMRDRNISATARDLHVHRNTVIYKLNQIKALIGDKADDPYVRHNLISSCMIIRYIENYHKREVDLPPLEKSLLKRTTDN